MHKRWLSLVGVATLVGCAAGQAVQGGLSTTTQTLDSTAQAAEKGEQSTKAGMDKTKSAQAQAKGQGVGPDGTPCPKDNTDPDCDGMRTLAKTTEPNEVINDEVGIKKNDVADWKKFNLGGRPGPVKVKIRWDDPSANLNIDLYDAFGANIATSPGKQREPEKKLIAQIESPGLYYVKVSSVGTPGSIYTMQLEWKGAPRPAATAPAPVAEPAPVAAQQVPPPGGVPGQVPPPGAPGVPGAAPMAPPAVVYPTPDNPNYPRCQIVQSYRDADGQMVLYINKGADAKVRAGMAGTILLGKEGDVPLDGGGFKITQVVDKQKSVAKSAISRVGTNSRCRVDLVPWRPPGM